MGFDGTARHFELAGDFLIVTALQQQIGNLLFAWPKANQLVFHATSPRI